MGNTFRVAVLHYHLKRGGVTRVIQNTRNAFQDAGIDVELAAVVGEPTDRPPLDKIAVIPALAYSQGEPPVDPVRLEKEIREAAANQLGGPPDLWHIHNHSLGKSVNMAGFIERLAASGDAILLHIHDFAEDNRPENYGLIRSVEATRDFLYPIGPQIGYAVLNGRDHQFLAAAGIPEESLFSLPNPVPQPSSDTGAPFSLNKLDPQGFHRSLVLYPVRATRRKNLGELVLWAALYSKYPDIGAPLESPLFVNTLGATNRDFVARYESWMAYVEKHALPVRFGIAEEYDFSFSAIVNAADAVISTSVAEGFGLGFLEPWTFGKPIVGRDLPEITGDFREMGVQLEELYTRIDVPLEWCGHPHSVRDHLLVHMKKSYQHYEQELSLEHLEQAVASILQGDRVDFGRLDEVLQSRIIDTLLDSKSAFGELGLNSLPQPAGKKAINANRKRIFEAYSPNAYAQSLHGVYQKLVQGVSENATASFLEPGKVLEEFLDPYRFNLLRS